MNWLQKEQLTALITFSRTACQSTRVRPQSVQHPLCPQFVHILCNVVN